MKGLAAVALLGAIGCGGHEEAAPPPALAVNAPDASRSGETTPIVDASAPEPPPPPPRLVPEPAFGEGSVRPDDPHAFRLAISLAAARKNDSAAMVLALVSALPAATDVKDRLGIDPLADGEWLLVYGKDIAVPGANANVLRAARPATTDGAIELLGVRDTLLRPRAGILALVPSDRANDFATALKAPIDPGLKSGEIARAVIAEPSQRLPLPEHVKDGLLVGRAASDRGIDWSAEVDCGADAPRCTTIATDLTDLVARNNGFMVRIVTRGLLNGFTVRVDGKKLKATLHTSPEQVEQLVSLGRAALGLPPPPHAADAGAP